jgi:DNA polymerase III epsilon subunit-like protein
MKTVLVFDLETTGLPNGISIFDLQNYNSCRIVQICWAFVSLQDNFSLLEPIKSRFIIPEGHTITNDMFCVRHGMNQEFLQGSGIPLRDMVRELRSDILKWEPSFIMGHNVEFDVLGIMAEIYRLYEDKNRPYEFFKMKDGSYPRILCTLELATILRDKNIKPYSTLKTRKLGYVYKTLTGFNLANAHTADADVLACIDIAKHMCRNEKLRTVLFDLDKNYDKGLLFTTQNKREWLLLVAESFDNGN